MTDIQNHFGRTRVDTLQVGTSPTAIGAAWKTFPVTLINATLNASNQKFMRYTVIGKTCTVMLSLFQNAAGTASGTMEIKLPIPPLQTEFLVGTGFGSIGGAVTTFAVVGATADTINLYATTPAAGPVPVSSSALGLNTVGAWLCTVQMTYEIA